MANKVIGDYTAAVTIDGATHYLLIQPGNSSTAYKKITRDVLLGVTGTPADLSTTQTFTNKVLGNTNTVTLKDTLFTLQDDGDTTKQAKFQLSGITTATTRTYTLPNASSTLADIATAQTLTNKTLTSPVITGGTIDNSTITVDSIAGHTSATIVSVAGLSISAGVLNTNNSVITANITDSAVTPAKLLTGTGSTWIWQTFSPSAVGWSSTTVAQYYYTQIGKTVFFSINVSGTSNSTSTSFTMPVAASTHMAFYGGGISIAQDNGAILTSSPRWEIATATSTTTLSCVTTPAGAGWTASGTKLVRLSGFYEAG